MALKDIVAKLASMDGVKQLLSEEELAELTNAETKPSDNDEWMKKAKDNEAKAARILAEKKATQEKYEELANKLEEIQSADMSDMEKLQKEVEKAQSNREKLEAELNETKQAYKNTTRKYELERIGGKINFLDTIPNDLREMSIEAAFKGVEDFTDEAAVNEALKGYVDSHKGIIASDKPSGGGSSTTRTIQSNNLSNKNPEDMSYDERAAALDGASGSRNKI